MYLRARGLLVGDTGRDHLTDEHRGARLRRSVQTAVGQHFLDALQFVRRVASSQVVQGDHRVGLATAEVSLQLDDGISAFLAEAAYGVQKQLTQTIGQERAAEELDGLAVLVSRLASPDLMEIGGELSLLVAA